MKSMRLVGAVVSVCFIAGLAIDAKAEVENLKPTPKRDFSKTKKLEGEFDEAAIGAELEASEVLTYQEVKREASADELRLKKDIQKMEAEAAQIKTGIDKARQDAEIAQKKLQLQQVQNREQRKRVAGLKKQKQMADDRNAKLGEQVKTAEAEAKAIAEEIREVESHIKMAEEDRDKLLAEINAKKAAKEEALKKKEDAIDKKKRTQNETKALRSVSGQ